MFIFHKVQIILSIAERRKLRNFAKAVFDYFY
jgi:hypothetical protein